MGEAARRSVLARFTWPAVVRRCLDCYREAGNILPSPLYSGERGRG